MITMKPNRNLLLLCLLFLLATCTSKGPKQSDETPTRGNIKIGVDESYQLLLDTEIYTFQAIYKNARINPIYANEQDIIELFIKDSIRNMIVNRPLTDKEKEYLNSLQFVPRTTKIAYDGVAFILNNQNPDSFLSYFQLKKIFGGEGSTWKKINKSSPLSNMSVVFDNRKSGNVRYLVEKLGLKDSLPEYCKAVTTNADVIEYVEKHKEAIGVVSVNWISDKHDSISNSFLKKIKVAAVSPVYDEAHYVQPYQAYIADQSYPFIREVYYISRETFSGLGSGFASFVAGDQGQRIILKSKLVPATMPVRLIHVSKE
jgi:phosphate transport system substrate-binding protein